MAFSSIAPAEFGGVSRAPGGMAGLTFNSFCPPVIQPNTRIIGLCGTTDCRPEYIDQVSSDEEAQSSKTGAVNKLFSKGKNILTAATSSKAQRQQRKEEKMLKARPHGLASPKEDGWFLSDFYLFHHLFQGLGAKQRWYTCESPRTLVSRYGQYAHGEAASDHRIVLDKNMLDALEAVGDIHVRPHGSLLQDFLDYFKAECKEAAKRKQPILLMIFGHGDEGTHGISIGGTGDADSTPRLKFRHLETSIRGLDIAVTLLTTACYSAGWLLQPRLNISALIAADKRHQSHSWDASLGQSYHGSIWASAVLETLIKMEDPKTTQFQHDAPVFGIDDLDEDEKSATFANLSEAIRRTLRHEVDGRDIHQISFAAQDDEWAQEWRQRSGIPLGNFQAQWDKLPRKPPRTLAAQRPSKTGNTQKHSASLAAEERPAELEHGFRKTLTSRQARPLLADKCYQYLSSFPGVPSNASSIRTFNAATSFLKLGFASTMTMAKLQAVLDYRLDAMKLATTLKDIALPESCEFPACHLFDYDSWRNALSSGERTPENATKRENYLLYFAKVHDAKLPGRPTREQGMYYPKPAEYLTAAFAENDLDERAVDTAIAAMLAYNKSRVETLTQRVRYDRSVRSTAGAAFRTLGKRLRSPSPQKRGVFPRFSSDISSH